MSLGQRIERRRKEIGVSQAELARRVGVRQSTIHSLIKGNSRSSRSLVKIARELRTTAAYLTGETSDPTADVPEETYTSDERTWVDFWRSLDAKQQRALVTVIESMLRKSPEPTLHEPALTSREPSNG